MSPYCSVTPATWLSAKPRSFGDPIPTRFQDSSIQVMKLSTVCVVNVPPVCSVFGIMRAPGRNSDRNRSQYRRDVETTVCRAGFLERSCCSVSSIRARVSACQSRQCRLQLVLIFGWFDHPHLGACERRALRRRARSSRRRNEMPAPPVPAPDGVAEVAREHGDHRDRDPAADGPRVEQSDCAEH